jgi:hypothetical protein
METFWQRNARYERYRKEGKARYDQLNLFRKDLTKKKEDGILRQSELWSLPSLDAALTKDYKNVAGNVEYLARQDLVLQKYLTQLDTALFRCQFGKCEAIGTLLKIDPLGDISKQVPTVDYDTGEIIETKSKEDTLIPG